jgi:hypothetical protein
VSGVPAHYLELNGSVFLSNGGLGHTCVHSATVSNPWWNAERNPFGKDVTVSSVEYVDESSVSHRAYKIFGQKKVAE